MTDIDPSTRAIKYLASLKADPLVEVANKPTVPNSLTTVQNIVGRGEKPILPYEREQLLRILADLGIEQRKLGEELGEAMSGTETFHDNPQAEAVVDESVKVSDRARGPMNALYLSTIVAYPEAGVTTATVGSIVGIRCDDRNFSEFYLLSGHLRGEVGFTEDAPYDPDTFAATVSSPIGAALLGKEAGQRFSYEGVDGKRRMTTIGGVVESVVSVDPKYLSAPGVEI